MMMMTMMKRMKRTPFASRDARPAAMEASEGRYRTVAWWMKKKKKKRKQVEEVFSWRGRRRGQVCLAEVWGWRGDGACADAVLPLRQRELR